MAQIHPTALVDPRAELGRDVVVGPFCVVEAERDIGDGCRLEARAVVKSRTTLGENNEIGEGAVIGGKAQHVHVHDPGGTLVIGSHNRIRENVTIHRGWNNDAATIVGRPQHADGRLARRRTIAESAIIASWSITCSWAGTFRSMTGLTSAAVRRCISSAVSVDWHGGWMAKITQDVPPFVMVEGGASSQVVGLNKVGLRPQRIYA